MTNSPEVVALTAAREVDKVCDRFELAWNAGEQPRIEAFLASEDAAQRSALLRGLLAVELELISRTGETLSVDSYRKRFPDHADLVASIIQEAIARGGRSSEELTGTVSFTQSPVDTSHSHESSDFKSDLRSTEIHAPCRPQDQSSPAQLGRFEILKVLGQGAFGTVYHARDLELDREVAIKVPRAASLGTDEQVKRFLREARAAASLRHPNICPVYEISFLEGRYAIVMAFIAGKPLSAYTKQDKPISERQAATLVRKVALALEVAHQKGIVHRDLKPDNIMIDLERHEPVVTDFGLARMTTADDVQLTASGQIMGTPAYMPPEQARGDLEKIGPAADIYSLGVIFYELLCGQRPFQSNSVAEVFSQILTTEPQPPSTRRPSVDRRLETICLKAMAKQIENRYASMAEIVVDLNDYLRAEHAERNAAAPGATTATHVGTSQPASQSESASALLFPLVGMKDATRLSVLPRNVTQIARSRGAWIIVSAVIFVISFAVYYIRTDYGTLIVEINDEQVVAMIQTDGLVIEDQANGRRYTINAAGRRPDSTGKYRVLAGQGLELLVLDNAGLEVRTNEFTLSRGAEVRVRVTLEAQEEAKAGLAFGVSERLTAANQIAEALAPGELDVLAQIDPRQDARNNVDVDGKQLTIRADRGTLAVKIPLVEPDATVPEEYDLIVRLTRQPRPNKDGGLGFALIFPLPGARKGEVYLDGYYGSGLSGIDGKGYQHPATHFKRRLFRIGVETEIVCSVRKDGITVAIDGAPWIQWKGAFTRFAEWPVELTPQEGMIWVHEARYVVSAIRLRRVVNEPSPTETDGGSDR